MHVTADFFIVYVPDDEIRYFESITDLKIQVKSQSELGIEFESPLRERMETVGNIKRFGWYLQQFYKIKAMQLAETEIVTIWDADCVPVAPIEIVNEHQQIVYVNSSSEYHHEYFENIKRLLNMERIQDICFVIPSFPMMSHWVTEFITFVETKHSKPWFEALTQTTNFSLTSGFSETETLGTWVTHKYPTAWVARTGTWERFGQSRFGYAKNLNVTQLLDLGQRHNLEIISFENWDVRGVKRIRRVVSRLRKQFR